MNSTGDWTLHDPWWLAVLLALPLVVLLRRIRRTPVLVVPFAAAWHRPGASSWTTWPAIVGYAGIALLVVALARPQAVNQKRETRQQGYDIVLVIDLSKSMETPDYVRDSRRISRLEAIKPVLEAFINQRTGDRIGVVVFAGHAYTLAPLTFDHGWLRRQMGRLHTGLIEGQTAIGDGLGVGLDRVEQGSRETGRKREGAFVVLLTDGSNNAGVLDPRKAADLAAERRVPIYTIGAGSSTMAFGAELDEGLLRDIASRTGGHFFRAADTRTIDEAFARIDQTEKIEFEARSFTVTEELFARFAIPGLVCLFVAAVGVVIQTHREVIA